MARSRQPGHPDPIRVGALRARATVSTDNGRWRWRMEILSPRRRPEAKGYITGTPMEVRAQLEGKRDTTPGRRTLSTWGDLLDAYMAARTLHAQAGSLAPETLRTDRYSRRRLGPLLDRHPLVATELLLLEEVRDRLLAARRASATAHLDLRLARKAWAWALRRKLLPEGSPPWVTPECRVMPTRAKVTPSRPHVTAVYAHLSGPARLAVLLLAATGCRPGELLALTWSCVDLDKAELLFRAGTVKTRKEGRVPLLPTVIDELRRAREAAQAQHGGDLSDRPVLGGLSAATLRTRALPRACAAAGVPRFPPYGLRRLTVDDLVRARVDPGTAAKVTRHHPRVMLEKYQSVDSSQQAGAVAQADLGAWLLPPSETP